jgi:hypothetical protein
LAPVRARHDELLRHPDELRRRLDVGAEKAIAVSSRVLQRARDAIGLGG